MQGSTSADRVLQQTCSRRQRCRDVVKSEHGRAGQIVNPHEITDFEPDGDIRQQPKDVAIRQHLSEERRFRNGAAITSQFSANTSAGTR